MIGGNMKRLLNIVLLVLTSCSFLITKSPDKNSVFAESSCSLPCWYEIAVGKTTKQELLSILNNISIVNQDSITVSESDTIFNERVFFTMGKGPQFFKLDDGGTVKTDYLWSGNIDILNNKVARIDFAGDLGLTIQQVVNIFGVPSYAIPFYTHGGHIRVELINPTQGVEFGYRADGFASELTPDIKIDLLTIFDATLYNELLQNNMFMFGSNDQETYTWKGFGNLSIYWPTK
jgi:hypothetical protein